MGQKKITSDPVTDRLTEILTVVQDMLIIQAANAGMGKPQVRKILGVADARVSRVWRHLRKASKD